MALIRLTTPYSDSELLHATEKKLDFSERMSIDTRYTS